jgi:hypothetical protein
LRFDSKTKKVSAEFPKSAPISSYQDQNLPVSESVSQILCEFYSLLTNPRWVRVVSSSDEALNIISAILALPGLYVLPSPARAVAGWMQLVHRHPVTGGDVFDLQIVATMQANGI